MVEINITPPTAVVAVALLAGLFYHLVFDNRGSSVHVNKNGNPSPAMSVRRGQKRAKSYQNEICKAKDLKLYQEFYFKVQNLEQNRDILPQARQLLLKMLTRSLTYAKFTTIDGNILAIETYNRKALEDFLVAEHDRYVITLFHDDYFFLPFDYVS